MKESTFKNINSQYQRKNIALMGHMGSGKSLIGKLLAKEMKYKHVDSDKLIVKFAKKTINDIFKHQGELAFRKLEEKIIIELKDKENIVLSLGGGSILSKKVRDLLKKKFITVFLDVDFSKLKERLEKNLNRPLLKNTDIMKKIKEMDQVRREFYLLADIVLNNYDSTQDTISDFFIKYRELNEKNN